MKAQILVISALFSVGVANAGERLKGDELKAFWTDKTIVGEHQKIGAIKTYHAVDGKVTSISGSGKERTGKWWIDESANTKCIEWDNKSQGGCHYTERNKDGSLTLIHGSKGTKLVEIKSSKQGNQL